MTAAFSLRDAERRDVAGLLGLLRGLAAYERLLHEVTATEAELEAALFGDNALGHAVLAEQDHRPVGFALFYYTLNTFKVRRNLFLEDLFVEPSCRGAGIGFALMQYLARKAVAEDCRRIEWRVLDWNQPAIDFYERLGAKPIEEWHTRQLSGDALAAVAKGQFQNG